MPTFAEIAGLEIPEGIDGISFLPALTGHGEQETHDHLYWEFHAQGGKQAVRQGKWKLIRLNYLNSDETTVELYNLDEDISETTNIAADHPEKVQELMAIMDSEHTPSPDFPFEPK
jgi:arylsulfatase A-like enzyme